MKRKFLSPKKASNDENTNRSDGTSLALGSQEHREMVLDRMGIDSKEQEKILLEESRRTTDNIMDEALTDGLEDKWHSDRQKYLESDMPALDRQYENTEQRVLTSAQRLVSHEVVKSAEMSAIQKEAAKKAAKTASKSDDRQVQYKLVNTLNKAVYDEGLTVDDFADLDNTVDYGFGE